MKEESKRWIKAGSIPSNDPNAKVLCPKCQRNNLIVEDIRCESEPEMLERYLKFTKCGSYNILRLRRPIGGGVED
jgi:DNA-directed RNA polymerase subunit M/transcription elongation factor TFIIS